MSSFAFRASAAALGGIFTRPFHEPVPVQAASMLASVGGYGSARVENFRFRELVSFRAAYTQVVGNEYTGDDGPERSTLVLSVVEGLNILDMVTADRIVGRLVSETPRSDGSELRWLPAGSYFVNLRIGGHLIEPQAHKSLADRPALMAGRQAFRGDKGAATCDAVERLGVARKADPVRFSMFGAGEHHYTIAGFGEVFLGEYTVGRDYRRLTMLRVAMGSPVEGDLSVADLQGNGSPY